jgi:hypothetical protein
MSTETFTHNVFLSAKDGTMVWSLAERLRKERLRVWPVAQQRPRKGGFGEWELRPGDRIPAKIEEKLKRAQFGLRISDFGFHSTFGVLASDLASPNRP